MAFASFLAQIVLNDLFPVHNLTPIIEPKKIKSNFMISFENLAEEN